MPAALLLAFAQAPTPAGQAAPLATHTLPTEHAAVLVGDGAGWQRVPLDGALPIALPLATLDELEPRARIEDERVRIALEPAPEIGAADALVLWAIPHARDERVLRLTTPGEPLLVARSRGLPAGARATNFTGWDEVLPLVARRDGVGVRAGLNIELDDLDAFDAADRLLLRGAARGGAAPALLWPVLDGREFGLQFELDSVEIVAVRELRASEPQRLARLAAQVVDERLELAFAAPAIPAAGMSWTLLLDSALAPRAAARSTRPASDAREAAGPWIDVARERGIDFVHLEGPEPQLDIRPTMGPGLAWGDADGDGWCDLYLAQGAGRAGSRAPLDRVWRNAGGKRFSDITAATGIHDEGAGMGVTFLDADGDGDLDVYVANYGRDRLYTNDGRGNFADVSDAVGLAGERWHAGVAAADYDQDGDVDVYVTSYLEYAPDQMPPREELAYQRDDPIEMLPFAFPGQPNTLWRNDLEKGALRFTDVAVELGVDDPAGRGMQAVWWDCDGDADLDLYVANDVSPNKLYRNEGGGRFKDVSFSSGLDDPRGSMGLAAEDVDGDLDLDLFVTNWQLEANALYVNNLVNARSPKTHTATFRDAIVQTRMAGASVGLTKWGAEFVDNDRDGDLDLFVANGYTSPDYESTGICVGQRCQYFEQDARLAFRERTSGFALAAALAHRALAACDYDQDGDLDLAVSSNNGPFRLLEWRGEARGHWLGVRLRQAGHNPFALGAEVRVRAGDRTWLRELRAGTSYLAGNPPELHFGLGAVQQVDAIEVRWPDGARTQHQATELDRWISLRRE